MIFPQSFRQLSQFAYNFYVLSKMGPKWQPRRWRHTCIRRAKLSMTRTHSSYGISLIFAVISAFSSPIVWGLFSFTLSLRYPHRWKSGGFKSGECAMRQYWWSFGHHWDGAEAYNSGSGKMGATPHKTNDSDLKTDWSVRSVKLSVQLIHQTWTPLIGLIIFCFNLI
jgi:hypothetical protein